MNNQDFYHLFKNSRIAQVAKPLSKQLRGHDPAAPTHQIVFTPKASATRSNYGLKSALPSKYGTSHIVYNNLDTRSGIADVEKYASPHYNRLKFQESNVVVNVPKHEASPFFAWDANKTSNKSKVSVRETFQSLFNLGPYATLADTKAILSENPELHSEFRKWLIKKAPESVLFKATSRLDELLKEFISTSDYVKKNDILLQQLVREDGKFNTKLLNKSVQAHGGLSYKQKGRLLNTPNGAKRGSIIPGRSVDRSYAALGGFVGFVPHRSVLPHLNYMKRHGDKHPRQFVIPFKVNDAEVLNDGGVKLQAEGVKAGSWLENMQVDGPASRNYAASNPNPIKASRRLKTEQSIESLLGLIR